jgi:lipid A disaccharide synthetase
MVSLPNIILNKLVVPELIQFKANVKNITTEIEKLLYDNEYRQNHINQLAEVKAKLSDKYSAEEVAKVIGENI